MLSRRNAELDLLRAYSILMVVVLHFARPVAGGTASWRWIEQHFDLWAGVDLFFAISGFVISKSLAELWAHKAGNRTAVAILLARFWVRRFWRLWPACMVWLTACLAGAIAFAGSAGWTPVAEMQKHWVLGVFYLFNFHEPDAGNALSYFWSLSLEWQFYMVFPLILVLIRSDAGRIGLLLAALLLGIVWRPGGEGWAMFRCDSLIAGILVYRLSHARLAARFEPRFLRHKSVAAVVTLAMLACIPALLRSVENVKLALALLALLTGATVFAASFEKGYVSDLGLRSITDWLGSRSYSIYLCHNVVALTVYSVQAPLFDWIGNITDVSLPQLPVYFFLIICATALFAELTHRLVEIRSQNLGRRLAGRIGVKSARHGSALQTA